MVFPSVPVYLDPSNWNQQQADQPGGSTGGGEAQHQLALPPQPGAAPHPEAGMAAGSVRQGSMAERARLAKMPQPEPALKCPRCDSTNTKFCYFNNYSLSQPRHFCKTCRRYWTRGGALRNVPVGGGCRRNKRSKASSSSSKSSASNSDRQVGASSSSSTATSASSGAIPSHMPPLPQLPFMSSLHPLPDYSASNIGINFTGIQPMDTVEYQVGSTSSIGLEQWRLQQIQQFPFVGGLEPSPQTAAPAPVPWLFPFDTQGGVHGGQYSSQQHTKASSSGLITQLASVKMEGNPQGLDLPRQFLGLPNNDQYWTSAGRGSNASGGGNSGGGASGWPADLSGFNSSSSGNLL